MEGGTSVARGTAKSVVVRGASTKTSSQFCQLAAAKAARSKIWHVRQLAAGKLTKSKVWGFGQLAAAKSARSTDAGLLVGSVAETAKSKVCHSGQLEAETQVGRLGFAPRESCRD